MTDKEQIEQAILNKSRSLLDLIDQKLSGGRAVLAIDGRCGSGKTTLAAALSQRYEASIVHMDDFYLPAELRTEERFREPGGNVHYERFMEEIVPCLHTEKPIQYRLFDPSVMEFTKTISLPPSALTIIEGSYSLRPEFRPHYDIMVFLNISPEEQSRRILKRNGPERHRQFLKRWIPLEEYYFTGCSVREHADLILDMNP